MEGGKLPLALRLVDTVWYEDLGSVLSKVRYLLGSKAAG